MSLHLRKRLPQWWAVIREEKLLTGSWPNPLMMVVKLFKRHVKRPKWRQRLKTCPNCPVFDGELRRCRGPKVGNKPPPGCGCYVPFLAIIKTPYTSADKKHTGCWGRATMGAGFGWD